MMKKIFLKLSMLLFVLSMGTNAAWAGISLDVPPTDWYYVNFETRVSTPACGSNPGQVKLNYTDNQGNQDNPWIIGPEPTMSGEYSSYDWAWEAGYADGKAAGQANDFNENYGDTGFGYDTGQGENVNCEEPNEARINGYNTGYNWWKSGHYLNTLTGETEDDYQTAWGTSANLNGYAMVHMADLDLDEMSAYAYFEAKVKENDGWYFIGWSYKEGDSDLGGAVDTNTPEDKGKLFKVFPSDLQGWSNKSKA